MAEATLSSKNQIVVPREAREALGVKPGDRLMIVVRNGTMIVASKPAVHEKAIRGLMKTPYPKNHVGKERRSWD